MTAKGVAWIVAGDFNMEPAVIEPWFNSVGAVPLATAETTCRQALPGTKLDYFGVDAKLLSRVGFPSVNECATTCPHRTVDLE
eukprot:6734175-Pyramimonas_sp.AAC.1